MIEASPPAPLQKRGEASLQLPGSEITQNTLNHEVLATEREPEGLGEMMKRVLHAVQLAVPIGIITRPNIAQSAQQYTDFYLSV